MKIKGVIAAIFVVLAIAVFRFAFAGETNTVVKTVLVKMLCSCGGEMKPTGACLTRYPPQYPHICNKCGTNTHYNVVYPEIRYVTE